MAEKIAKNNKTAHQTPVLTPQEQKVLNMLIEGTAPKEIGYRLNISYDTVKYHQKKLYEKLDVHSVFELRNKYLNANTADAKETLAKQLLPGAFQLIPKENPPYGWVFHFEPDVFQYNDKYYPSPFKLGKGNRLVEGDMWHITCFFTSNVEIKWLLVSFIDKSIDGNLFLNEISGPHKLGNFYFKANTRYNLSAKILITQTASGASPIENIFSLGVGCFLDKQPVITFHKFEVVKLPQQNILKSTLSNQSEKIRQYTPDILPLPNPLVITFDRDINETWASWKYTLYPDIFLYNGIKTASPFMLGEGNRIVENDIFLVNLFFTSNVDIDFLQVHLLDTTVADDHYWTQLSPYVKLKKNIKAGIENNITIKLLATKTASGTSPAENQFVLITGPGTKEQPTLSFTKFEIVKI
ncbi:MAG: helix-turn-helix domain-containing protein [Treponema sp.]|jgi:DNA-binding CsgD family transcriptional regulator|nr:helix-turn-helix domain-containing protein [Treponema sp.]